MLGRCSGAVRCRTESLGQRTSSQSGDGSLEQAERANNLESSSGEAVEQQKDLLVGVVLLRVADHALKSLQSAAEAEGPGAFF